MKKVFHVFQIPYKLNSELELSLYEKITEIEKANNESFEAVCSLGEKPSEKIAGYNVAKFLATFSKE